ncbi:hypothetical protein JKA74_15825 [Marivirga sp. S37H4]|uniref:Glycosyl transferase n=1 Tax=Marivirga aurantiaca TaxID=2802615 RepID=A0A935CAF4_9BACT|nr:ATP-grasp fold amidoligase family protein [Marivirga aurantiaca]MBK6266514.1 hypothetical protein [Marivirga aurantiaca]
MREVLKKFYNNSKIGGALLQLPKSVYDFYRYKILSDEVFLKSRFKYELGYKLDLEKPETYNQKIQWLKIHDRTPLHTTCADKYAVRDFIAKEIGAQHLIPLILYTNNPSDLRPENFQEKSFIIKATHSSGRNHIVKDKNIADWSGIRKKARKWLNENFYYCLREWQYKNIPPAIIVEQLLQDENGLIPFDFKIHCFHGEVEIFEVHENRHFSHKKLLYDKNWNVQDFITHREKGTPIAPPKNLELMKSIAQKLAKHFCYVRVDLYEVNGNVYFGELTFHPGSGFRRFYPFERDRMLGEKLTLPIEQ